MAEYFTEIPGYASAHSPYSHAVVANGFVFVSGQVAVRPGGTGPLDLIGETTAEQTRQALENLKLILEHVGSSLDDAVKITVLLTDPDEYREMNAVYAEFFPNNKPARSIAQLGARVPGVRVSIDAIATI
ncbi:MAG TPA: RidA family protein [Pyrinomonadaceae bacterium]|jgi:2-iminobutanoate/2-iminopropanoate deaminase|nr:RidA family protein [Pyrinomonadaceae bacterium]